MKHIENNSEFYWEKLLRENDEKIFKYMEKLPRYIHIPGEFNFTLPNSNDANAFYTEETEEDERFFLDWQESRYANKIKKVLAISQKWLIIYSAALSVEEKKIALTLISYLAMITGQLIALANNAEDENNSSFEIALLKRVRKNISSTESFMKKIGYLKPEMKDTIIEQLHTLSELSEELADQILSKRKHK